MVEGQSCLDRKYTNRLQTELTLSMPLIWQWPKWNRIRWKSKIDRRRIIFCKAPARLRGQAGSRICPIPQIMARQRKPILSKALKGDTPQGNNQTDSHHIPRHKLSYSAKGSHTTLNAHQGKVHVKHLGASSSQGLPHRVLGTPISQTGSTTDGPATGADGPATGAARKFPFPSVPLQYC